MLIIELPTATLQLPVVAGYTKADFTIRILSNCYYSAEYRIAIHPTIRPRSEHGANIWCSPSTMIIKKTTINSKEDLYKH